MLGITDLYRTGLPPSDPNYVALYTGRDDYEAKTGQQAADDDPTQQYKFWSDLNAGKLPPTQIVTYLFWNGSVNDDAALIPQSMTAAQAFAVILPGDQTFPDYVVPVTNSMWTQVPGFPPNTFPSSWLSRQVDAIRLVAMFSGATLETGQQCFPAAVFNIDPAFSATWQPWVMVMPNGTKTFCGGMIAEMKGQNSVNGGGDGSPGNWVANSDGSAYAWVPTPPPDKTVQSTSTLGIPCNPIPDGYEFLSVANGIFPTLEIVPIPAPPVPEPTAADFVKLQTQVDWLYTHAGGPPLASASDKLSTQPKTIPPNNLIVRGKNPECPNCHNKQLATSGSGAFSCGKCGASGHIE